MYKIIALIGESGSGKDTLMKRVLAEGDFLHKIVNCTTRPKREREIDKVNYYFYPPGVFAEKILNDEMIEVSLFNDWAYGTSYDSIDKDKINIGVFNPTGIEFLLARQDIEVKIFYVCATPKTRLLRQLNREDCPDVDEIVRRYGADKEDFSKIEFERITIPNENRDDLRAGTELILSIASAWECAEGKKH